MVTTNRSALSHPSRSNCDIVSIVPSLTNSQLLVCFSSPFAKEQAHAMPGTRWMGRHPCDLAPNLRYHQARAPRTHWVLDAGLDSRSRHTIAPPAQGSPSPCRLDRRTSENIVPPGSFRSSRVTTRYKSGGLRYFSWAKVWRRCGRYCGLYLCFIQFGFRRRGRR